MRNCSDMTREHFAALHKAGDPLVLFNIWDAGSAMAVAKAGAKAIATGSASLAGAQGFGDGEQMPFPALVNTATQIANAVELPLSIDFEAGFAEDVASLAENAKALKDAGAVGCNLEDRLIHKDGLRNVDEQAERIAAVDAAGLFVNARTDVFLSLFAVGEDPNRQELVETAILRGRAYAAVGAGSFFIPALTDPAMIAQICKELPIPVNAMRLPGMVSNAELAKLGVARISYGPGPWSAAMAGIEAAAKDALSA